MPTAEQILQGLTAVANDWMLVAVAWHLVIGAALVAVLVGWRPAPRLAASLITTLPASAAIVAIAAGNPFNGIVLAATALALALLTRAPASSPPASWVRWAGVAMIAYGWFYPHFLEGDVVAYAYAAPVGLVPCPTLAMAMGLALAGNVGERRWRRVLAGVAAFYAMFGMLRLGVLLDAGLLVGAIALVASSVAYTTIETRLGPARGAHSA